MAGGCYWPPNIYRYLWGMVLSRLRVLVFPESIRWWTARSLEHDIAVSSKTAETALDSLIKIAQAHVAYDVRHGRLPLSAFAPAPRPYWSAFPAHATLRLELRHPDEGGPTIHVVAARLTQHPIIAPHVPTESRDAVVASLERQADPVLGANHDRGDRIVGKHLSDPCGYRRAVSGAGV